MANNVVCVVMQPTYLPWNGFFDLIDQSTVFVFLDSVQFEKGSWQQRNQIRTPKGLEWLTVPVKRRYPQLINEVEIIQYSSFPHDHIRTIENNYGRAPYFNTYFPGLLAILNENETHLSNLNQRLIKWIVGEIGITARFELSSVLEIQGKRTDLLVDICRRVNAGVYLSTIGAADYLIKESDVMLNNNIELLFHNYEPIAYRQVYKPFIPYASALDLLFNEGERSLEIIRSGRRKPLTIEDVKKRTTDARTDN